VDEIDRGSGTSDGEDLPGALPAVAVDCVRVVRQVAPKHVRFASEVQFRAGDAVREGHERIAGEVAHLARRERFGRSCAKERLAVALERRHGTADGRRDGESQRAGPKDELGHPRMAARYS
jgi:hypothetical protein